MDPRELLSAVRVTKLMRSLQDLRGIPGKLVNLRRTPVIPAAESEIMAQFQGQILIADLIADGQRAGVYSAGKMALIGNKVPNLKIGAALNQDQLNQLMTAIAGVEVADNLFPTTESRIVDNLRMGVSYRMEALIVAAKIGDYSYDRLGIKLEGVNFGMPADLKITIADEWTDSANAKPVSDIMLAKRIGSVKYGIVYDRIVMTLSAFNAMIATTEFQNKSRTYLAPNVSFTNLNGADTEFQRNLATNVLGVREIEINDARFWQEGLNGSLSSAPFVPNNKVILESSQNDNDASALDFANGVVTEALISNMPGSKIRGQLPLNARGPVGYQTAEDNPPSATYWGVGRGFPRRHLRQLTACLTVAPDSGTGSIEETIDFAEIPFS
jgi:hypothetical protein